MENDTHLGTVGLNRVVPTELWSAPSGLQSRWIRFATICLIPSALSIFKMSWKSHFYIYQPDGLYKTANEKIKTPKKYSECACMS